MNEEKEIERSVEDMKEKLEEWNEKRKKIIEEFRWIAREIGDWTFGTSVSKIVGNSVGIAGAAAVFFPPLAIGGLIMGVVGGLTHTVADIAKREHLKDKARRVQFLLDNDLKDFNNLIKLRDELLKSINNYIEYYPLQNVKPVDLSKLITKVTSLPLFGKLPSRAFLRATAVASIPFDVASLIENIHIVAHQVPNSFGARVYELSIELEEHRKSVMESFNPDE